MLYARVISPHNGDHVSLGWHRRTELFLSAFLTLTAAIIVYTWLYGAVDTSHLAYGVLRIFALECVLVLLIWRRLAGAAWLARLAWCWLLGFTAFVFITTLEGFRGDQTPPAVPYDVPIVPLLAIQLAILLAPAVRRHVWNKDGQPSHPPDPEATCPPRS
jgi:hypothetical protein